MTNEQERRAIVEVELVAEKLKKQAYSYLMENEGKPLNAMLRAEVDRRLEGFAKKGEEYGSV